MTTVLAVYEGGVLPAHPLPFGEGETLEITIAKPTPPITPLSEDEVTRRLQAAKTMEEWIAATKLLPPDDGGYDIVKALDENRLWSGELPKGSTSEGAP